MNIWETEDLIKYIDTENGAEVAEQLLPVLFKGAPLGVACHLLGCAYCGNELVSFHPIPFRLPAECPECGKLQCYIIGELR
jgi:hypothetical protein